VPVQPHLKAGHHNCDREWPTEIMPEFPGIPRQNRLWQSGAVHCAGRKWTVAPDSPQSLSGLLKQ
jgi:hypothetical protein